MKKHFLQKQNQIHSSNHLILYFSGMLLIGAVLGVLTASCLNLTVKQTLFSDVTNFLYTDHSCSSYWQALWKFFRTPGAVLLLTFTCFGFFCIPVVVGLQGYLFSFSVAVMVRLLGWKGLLLGISSFGIQAMFLFPCLLVLSTQGFLLSKQLFFFIVKRNEAQGKILLPHGFFFALFLSCMLLLLGAAFDFFFTDDFISLITKAFIIS